MVKSGLHLDLSFLTIAQRPEPFEYRVHLTANLVVVHKEFSLDYEPHHVLRSELPAP